MQRKVPWQHSLKFQLSVSIIILFSVLAGAIFYTLLSVNARQHDYAILNLAGQLRVITTSIINQSQRYKASAPRDYDSYYRDLDLYNKNITEQLTTYEKIITAFVKRDLPPELTGLKAPLTCSWDKPSIIQLNQTASFWRNFRTGLELALGDDKAEPRLEAGAEYILANADALSSNAENISIEFRNMMQHKLDEVKLTVRFVLILAVLFTVAIALLIYLKIIKPINRNMSGVNAIAAGNFNHEIPVKTPNELGKLGQAINQLSASLNAIFTLTQHVNQAQSVDQILKTVFDEFREISPINWAGLLRVDTTRTHIILERTYSDINNMLMEQKAYKFIDSLMKSVIDANDIAIFNDLPATASEHPESIIIKDLITGSMKSALFLPLTTSLKDDTLIIFASTDRNAYVETETGLLNFISSQLTHSYEKNIVMESLVISAVEGLAKLAESRDPETGDHLLRMSIYSSIIASQLKLDSNYSSQIDDEYIRDILKFAPMHDIGKVGIEDRILLKPGKLTDEERQEMQHHPEIGGNVLRRCEEQMLKVGRSIFKLGIEIADSHHEKYDGTGYPRGLSGTAIPLSARIVAAADVFDALTSKRPYKEAWPVDRALTLMREEAGRHFDPVIIESLEKALPEIMEVYEQHKHV